ncbi:hypothetical protein PMAYCL1PPCAC_22371, partial [Pristionchus mayeri]
LSLTSGMSSEFYAAHEIKFEEEELEDEPIQESALISQEESILNASILDKANDFNDDINDVNKKVYRLTCVVCNRLCDRSEMRHFAKDPNKRTAWINSVRSTTEERRWLMELLSVVKNPFLCVSHFSPSDFSQCAKRIVLRSDAVP